MKHKSLIYFLKNKFTIETSATFLCIDHYSLNQIANCLKDEYQIVLSKSGVNHILNKFHEKYQELVNE